MFAENDPNPAKRTAVVVKSFRDATATPEDASRILRAIAQQMNEDAAELKSVWQNRNAGKCWQRCARLLEKASETLLHE